MIEFLNVQQMKERVGKEVLRFPHLVPDPLCFTCSRIVPPSRPAGDGGLFSGFCPCCKAAPHTAEAPPSTMIVWPVMKPERLEQRKRTGCTTSEGSAIRPAGMALTICS